MPRTKLIDTQLLSYILDFLSVIADLSFSIYDGNGVLLMPPKSEKRLTAYRKSYTSESKENEAFICEGVVKAVIRRDPFLFKGHAKGYYLFIPVYADNFKLVLVSNAFYLSRAEFEDFLPKNEERFDVSTSHPELGDETLKVKDYSTVLRMAVHIKYLIEAFLRCDHAKKMNYKRFKSANIITDVLSSIQLPASTEKIYSLVLDTILLLFDVDTISIMVNGKNVFKTLMASGRLRNDVKHLCLEDDHPLLSLSTKEFIPVFTNDVMKIMRLGFLNDITSMHVFPLSYKEKIHSLVVLYNSIISEEESHSILEFCKLLTLVLESLTVQNAYDQCVTDIDVLNIAVTKLIPHLHNHKALCETILYKAMELSKAEKGSLILPEDDSLVVKAVKGINRWLVQDIKIKKGEGIAGRVFMDGTPVFSQDIEKLEVPGIKPKSHYKTGSFMSVPLTFGSETIGVLNIADKITGQEFAERDFHLIRHFTSHTSMALKISDYQTLAEQMKKLSITDPLTGLIGRKHFHKRFIEEINRSGRYKGVFSFAIADIDDFRLFNDMEGHLAGDNVLKEVARIARECIRAYDILSRFGGEEFGIVMPQTDKEEAFVVAERIRENIKASLMNRYKRFFRPSITVSIGITSFPQDGRSMDELIESVDAALYKAKSAGKDRTVVCNLFNNETRSIDIP